MAMMVKSTWQIRHSQPYKKINNLLKPPPPPRLLLRCFCKSPNCRIKLSELKPIADVFLKNVKEIGVGSLNQVKNPYVSSVVVAASLACVLAPLLLRKIHDDKCDNSYEDSVWSALEKPLQFLVLFLPLTSSVPSTTAAEQKVTTILQSHAVILSLVCFLLKLKSNFVTSTLDVMEAKGALPANIAKVKVLSTFGTIYLGGLAYYQFLGRALEYVMLLLVFLGVPLLYSTRKILGHLLRSWFEQS